MRRILMAACIAATTVWANGTLAQTPPADNPPVAASPAAPPPASPPVTAAPAAPQQAQAAPAANKRRECRRDVKNRGLRGSEAIAQAAVCVAQAQLDCTKQAAAKSLGRKEFKELIRDCMGQRQRTRAKR